MKKTITLIAIAVCALCRGALAQILAPDLTLNGTGTLNVNFTGLSTTAIDAGLQSDGKIITLNGYNSGNAVVSRHLATGAIDNSFGNNGYYYPMFGYNYKMLVMPDNRILLACRSTGLSSNNAYVALIRLTAAGQVDTSFNHGSVAAYYYTSQYSATYYLDPAPSALAVQPDGKILLGADVIEGIVTTGELRRFNPNGTADNAFGSNGRVFVPPGSCGNACINIHLKPNGNILVAGSYFASASDHHFSVTAYLPDGTLDSAYGTAGVAHMTSSTDAYPSGSVLQPDGKVILCGRYSMGYSMDMSLIRFDAAGQPDAAFGTGGRQTTDFNYGWDMARAIALDNNGNILMAGLHSGNGTGYSPLLYKLRADGTVISNFNNGNAYYAYTNGASRSYDAMKLFSYPDGRVMLYGYVAGLVNYYDNTTYLHRIYTKPLIQAQTPIVRCEGDLVLLSCPLNYSKKWFRDNQLLPDTGTYLTVTDSGDYRVYTYNANFGDTSAAVPVRFNAKPAPQVLQNGNQLTTAAAASYQWTDSAGISIAGATAQTFTPAASGWYRVRVTGTNGCSGRSDAFYYYLQPSGIANQGYRLGNLVFYPNPVRDALRWTNMGRQEQGKLRLFDLGGKQVLAANIEDGFLNMSVLPAGIYLVRDEHGAVLYVNKQ